ncbi:MAG: hypothetical protein AAGE03_02625 [Pseudomonadota bacterium]
MRVSLLILLFWASAAGAQPSRDALIDAMSVGVDMCLEALRTGDTSEIDALPKQPFPNPVLRNSWPALADGLVLLAVNPFGKPAQAQAHCQIITGERQATVTRLALRRWGQMKTSTLIGGAKAISIPASRTRPESFYWCEEDFGPILLMIGPEQPGADIHVQMMKAPFGRTLGNNEPSNPCSQE